MSDRKRKFYIFLDKIIGELIFFLIVLVFKNKGEKIRKGLIKNILLIRPGGIGDFILSVPAFKRLRGMFPNATMHIFTFSRNNVSLELYNGFDESIVIDKPRNFLKFILGKKNYDVVIDFDQHRKLASVLSVLSRAGIRIGFRNNNKDKVYNYPVRYDIEQYEAINFLGLIKPLGGSEELKEKDLLLVDSSCRNSGCKNIGIYAAAMKKNNRLPVKKWMEIMEHYGRQKTYYFLGGEADQVRYDELEQELDGFNIIRKDGKLRLGETFTLITDLDLLLAEDGGVYHMGVVAGIPTVSYWLHGEGNMKNWKAPFRKHKGRIIKKM